MLGRLAALARGQRDAGSMAVEFVFVGPLLLLMMLFLVYAGSAIEAHSQVDGAARDAARAASLAQSYPDAESAAQSAVTQDMPGCPATLGTDLLVRGWPQAGEVPPPGRAEPPPADVQVKLSCPVNLSFLGFGFPDLTMTAFAAAPLDTYVPRTPQ